MHARDALQRNDQTATGHTDTGHTARGHTDRGYTDRGYTVGGQTDGDHPLAAPPDDPIARLHVVAERLSRTASVARALLLAGRSVDLAGINDGVGMLCAMTLDLPHNQARQMLPALHTVLAQMTSLTAALRGPPQQDPEPDDD